MIPIRYNLRSLVVRRTTSVMTALGVALVVMILMILLGFVGGLKSSILRAGEANNWILLSRGVTNEPGSYITREQFEIIKSRTEIATSPSGEVLISPEMVTGFDAPPEKPATQTFIRGVTPIAYKVHSGIRVVAGRFPAAGQSELFVGRKLAARFAELNPSQKIRFGRRMWTIVGTFEDHDSSRESEVWTDLDVLQQDIRYANGFASLHTVLKPGTSDTLKQALNSDARLRIDLTSETDFYADQAKFADQLRGLGMVVAIILGIGATFGGMNTMYAAVARRGREVGVLRALGFGSASVLTSFVIESILLAIAGGIAGEVLGVLVSAATGLNSKLMTVAGLIFHFRLGPSAFVGGLIAAVIIGTLGGILPAYRAARIGVIDSLRTA
jgi:putative ABC transport system permease protein